MAPTTAHAINAGFPAPRNDTSSPTNEPMPAPTTASMIRLPTYRGSLIGFLVGLASDENLLARMYQLQALANFQLLLHGIIGEAPNVFPLPLDFASQTGVTLLQLLNLALFFEKRRDSARTSQRYICVTGEEHDTQQSSDSEQWCFHQASAWKIIVTSLAAFSAKNFRMTDAIVVLSTSSSHAEGEKLARLLLDARLAACVSVLPGMRSYYHWNGAVETSDECLLLIKSARRLLPELKVALEAAHSYQVPEVLALTVVDGASNYLNWLASNLRKEESHD